MAESRKAQGDRRGKTNKKTASGKKGRVVIWGMIVLIVALAAVFITSGYHEQVTQRVKQNLYPQGYSEYVEQSAKEFDLDPALVYAVIRTESNFNPDAVSGAGAHGLMQITDDTFAHYGDLRGESGDYSTEALYDPALNIEYGCHILRDLLDTFGDERCAVAAYNAGPGNVEKWLADEDISPDGKTLVTENIPFEETRSYVERVEESKEMYHQLYG